MRSLIRIVAGLTCPKVFLFGRCGSNYRFADLLLAKLSGLFVGVIISWNKVSTLKFHYLRQLHLIAGCGLRMALSITLADLINTHAGLSAPFVTSLVSTITYAVKVFMSFCNSIDVHYENTPIQIC